MNSLVVNLSWGDEITKVEMDRTCSTYVRT